MGTTGFVPVPLPFRRALLTKWAERARTLAKVTTRARTAPGMPAREDRDGRQRGTEFPPIRRSDVQPRGRGDGSFAGPGREDPGLQLHLHGAVRRAPPG